MQASQAFPDALPTGRSPGGLPDTNPGPHRMVYLTHL